MGNLLARFRQKDARIIFLGLDSAGKTTILYRLKLDDLVSTVPTIGFNVETIHYKDMHLTAWDIGSKDKVRPLFRQYYKGADAVVFVIDSQDPERLDELNYDVVKPAVGAEELTSAVFLFLANKMDLPATMTTDQIADRLGLRFLKHPWGILPVSAVSGDGLQAALEWLAVRLGSNQVRPKTFATLEARSMSQCRNTQSSLSSSASSNATWRTDSTKRRISKMGSFRAGSLRGGSISGPHAVTQKPVILLNSRLYREALHGNTTSPTSGSGGNASSPRMSVSGESGPGSGAGQTGQGSGYHRQHRPSYYDPLHTTPRRTHGSVVNCFSSYSISQSMREDLRGARKFSTISQSDIRRLSCASLTVHAAAGRRQSSVSLQERCNISGNRKMSAASLVDGTPYRRKLSAASLVDGTPYRRKMSTSFIIDPPNYRKFSSASLMESPFARKYSDASLTGSLHYQRKMSSVSAGAALGDHAETPPEEVRQNFSYLTVTPNVVATPPTGKRKSVDLALQGFGQFTPMMADYIQSGMKDSDTSADSLNLMSGSTNQSSSTGGAAIMSSPSTDPAAHALSMSILRKSPFRISKGRYVVNQPLSAAAAHPMVDQYTEELYRLMPEKYGSLTGRTPTTTQHNIVGTSAGTGTGTGTDGGSDSGADISLPVPSRNLRKDSLLNPRKHGYDFTLPTAAHLDKTHTVLFASQERRQSKTPRKSSVSQERRHSKSAESLKGHGRRHSRQSVASKDNDRRHSKSNAVTGRQDRRHSKSPGSSKEHDRRHSRSTAKGDDRRHSKSSGARTEGRKHSKVNAEDERRYSNPSGRSTAEERKKSGGILKAERRQSRTRGIVIIAERRYSRSTEVSQERRNSKSPGASPHGRRHSRAQPPPTQGRRLSRSRDDVAEQVRRGSRSRDADTTSNNSSSSGRRNSRSSSRERDSDSSLSSAKGHRSSTFDLFTCSPMHKRWALPYSCRGKTRKSQSSLASRFPASVAPACMRAYSALKCLFFRPTQSEMRAETNSVSSDDDAEVGEEEDDNEEKESEGDGDDEAEDCDERKEMFPSSVRTTKLDSATPSESVKAAENSPASSSLPTCSVTVTVEEADKEEELNKDSETDRDKTDKVFISADETNATDQSPESVHENSEEAAEIETNHVIANLNNSDGQLNLTPDHCEKVLEDKSTAVKSLENLNNLTSTKSCGITIDKHIELYSMDVRKEDSISKIDTGNLSSKKTDSNDAIDVENENLKLNGLDDTEIVLDSDFLVEINECFDSVFFNDEPSSNKSNDIEHDSINDTTSLNKDGVDRSGVVTKAGVDKDEPDTEKDGGSHLDLNNVKEDSWCLTQLIDAGEKKGNEPSLGSDMSV